MKRETRVVSSDVVSEADIRLARERFAALVNVRASEARFQRLFAQCPYIFSRSLPLRVEPRDFVPLARPGRSETDFVFYPHEGSQSRVYGAIEIKRPDSKILTKTRGNIVTLTRDAATAVAQAQASTAELELQFLTRPDEFLFLGGAPFLFVIMGLTSEIASKLATEALRLQIEHQMPRNCQLLPYDELLHRFEASIAPRVIALVPATGVLATPETTEERGLEVPSPRRGKYRLTRDGDHDSLVREFGEDETEIVWRMLLNGWRPIDD